MHTPHIVRPTAFGALLRIRLSTGLAIDVSPDEPMGTPATKIKSSYLNDACYRTAGIYGPVSLSAVDDELYCMGSCDPLSTLSFNVTKTERSGIFDDEEYHEYSDSKPVVQASFAYTAVVEHDGGWVVVRRLRVLTYSSLKIAKTTEEFTSSVDTNALAVVSY